MRASITATGLTFTAYAGTTGVQLAWDADEALRSGLLGFAIRRLDERSGRPVRLKGGLRFPRQAWRGSEPPTTDVAPIQAFRWADYAVYPDTCYEYTLVPLRGTPGRLVEAGGSVSLTVRTEATWDRPGDGPRHSIAFNRAAAAAEQYARRFGAADPRRDGEARRWLARGLDDFIRAFIARAADDSWAVDVIVYELESPSLHGALLAAEARGAEVRLVYHARPWLPAARAADPQTQANHCNASDWSPKVTRPRETAAICHDKSIVLSRFDRDGRRQPIAVLTGSASWTFGGLVDCANLAHAVEDSGVAARYLARFEQLFAGADQRQLRTWVRRHNPIPAAVWTERTAARTEVLFSPRPGLADVRYYADLIAGAERSVLFVAGSHLPAPLHQALLPALRGGSAARRYGLLNDDRGGVIGVCRVPQRWFRVTEALASAPSARPREVARSRDGDALLHGRVIVIDLDTPRPIVIVGSTDFGADASGRNDENVLVIRDDTRVADIYACEVLRHLDTYRRCFNQSELIGAGTVERRPALARTPAWTARYYDDPDGPRARERRELSRPGGEASGARLRPTPLARTP